MLATWDEIREAALRLPERERTSLVVELIDSFGDESAGLSLDSPDLEEELDRRATDRENLVAPEALWTED